MQYKHLLFCLLLNYCAVLTYAQCPVPFEIEILPNRGFDCGDTFQLEATPPITDSVLQINWTTITGNIVAGEQTLKPYIDAEGAYAVKVSATIDNVVCVAEKQVFINYKDRPALNILFPKGVNCNRTEVLLEAVDDVNKAEYLYEWTTMLGNIVSDPNMPTVTVNSGGIYNLKRSGLMGECPVNVPVVVFEERIANFYFDFLPPDCEQTEGLISFTNIIGGSGTFTYSIDGGMTFQEEPDFFIPIGGNYSLVVKDESNDCFLAKDTMLAFIPIVQDLSLPTEVPLKKEATYQLPLNINLPDSLIEEIQWTPAEGLSCTNCPNPFLTVSQNQTYEVIVTDINGCEAAASIEVIVTKSTDTYIPSIFSPNLDGRNDRFIIHANTKKVSKIQELLIFDRYGSLVFENNDFLPNNPAKGWDGRFKNQDMPTGIYAFFAQIEFVDGTTKLLSGPITLVR